MPTFEPVDFDPFAASSVEGGRLNSVKVSPAAAVRYEPVDHDPFAESKVQKAVKVAKGLGSALDAGLNRGIAGLGGAVGDLANLGAEGIHAGTNAVERFVGMPETPAPDRSKSILNELPTSEKMLQHLKDNYYDGEDLYQPQNKLEEYAQTIGEFGIGGVGGAGRRVLQRIGQVVLPAVTSETAGQATKGKQAEPYARFAGALVGGAGASMLSRPGTTAQAIRQQLPEGVTPQMVDQAEALMQHAAGQGIQIAWPEALSQVAGRPVLTNMMRHLEASPQTEGRMAEFFGQRPQQVENAARGQFDNIAPVNPDPSRIGRAVGDAAEAEVTATRRGINQQAQPHYRASENVLLTPAEMARVRAIPGYEEARQAIRDNPQLNRYVAHLPDESVGFLNEVKKQLDTASQNAVGPFNQQPNQQVAAGYGADARRVRRTAQVVDARYGGGNYSEALRIEREGRRDVLQPLLDGYIGKLAKSDQTTQQAIRALFPSGKDALAGGEQEIGRAVGALANRNARAARDLVRAHIEGTFNNAAKDLQPGANQAGGAKFRAQLVGNSQEAANLEAAVTALPNGAERWAGFNRFLDVLEATGTRQGIGSRTAYNAEINKGYSAGGVARDAVKVGTNPVKALQPLLDRYDQYKLGRNLDQLARLLTDPGSANQLRAIARMPDGSAAATSMALRLVAYGEGSK